MSNELPFSEKINAISINPEMASLKEIADMAAIVGDLLQISSCLTCKHFAPTRVRGEVILFCLGNKSILDCLQRCDDYEMKEFSK